MADIDDTDLVELSAAIKAKARAASRMNLRTVKTSGTRNPPCVSRTVSRIGHAYDCRVKFPLSYVFSCLTA